jgi:YjjG family noncanonical pyrimidine nucleotidase
MPLYECIFFDLDHTLWDFETNSGEALAELYKHYELEKKSAASPAEFSKTFTKINTGLWDRYDRGELHRDVLRNERFHLVLSAIGINDYEMSLRFSGDYLNLSPKKKNVMPGAIETLDYLVARYPLYIITNGFDEVQLIKMTSAGIHHYFKKIFSSEKIGHKKPSREIFEHALSANSFRVEQAVMIGDNLLTDMQGARNARMDHVFFNPNHVAHQDPVTYEIHHLSELKNIL